MKKLLLVLLAQSSAVAWSASVSTIARQIGAAGDGSRLTFSADRMSVNAEAGTLSATGHVNAAFSPFRLVSDSVSGSIAGKDPANPYRTLDFGPDTMVTTCTNDLDHLHWCGFGTVVYRNHESGVRMDGEPDEFEAWNMSVRLWDVPVAWLPWAWKPLNTDYGFRFLPGYTSRWGTYLLSKYVYDLAGDTGENGRYGLGGSTRFDLRTKNGVALGQGLNWNLGDFGRGKFKVYYAWDDDADRYDKHWKSDKWHYSNWGSTVPDERYGLTLEHRWHASDADLVRVRAAYYSDSHFRGDFLRHASFGLANRYPGADRNELAWEHAEATFVLGASVAGQLNDFYGATARLPEVFLDVAPQPLFGLPVDYESQSRLGWLNRTYAKHGGDTTALPFRYDPGRWADYQAFRVDTYHRLSVPFKVADLLSVVPRVGLRGTWWSDSGNLDLTGTHRAGSRDDDVTRSIVEGGVTFAARGTGWLSDAWQHLVEPYADVLAQEAQYSGLGRGARPYIFDSVDASADWLDQFAGRSRNLPYSWYGVTPGLRNAFRKAGEDGRLRTVFDLDLYAAVQMNDTSWTEGGRYHRLVRNPERPNYGRDGKGTVSPGVRARWFATDDMALASRAEWDGENDTLAYADVSFRHTLSQAFKYELSYSARDQRWWDYSSTPYDAEAMRNEDFNWSKFSYAQVAFEHELCDAVAWGPYVRWDFRENELDEIGAWIDLRTDCLGFRFSLSYENDYRRIDDSERRDNWRGGFSIYLRAFGPSNGLSF